MKVGGAKYLQCEYFLHVLSLGPVHGHGFCVPHLRTCWTLEDRNSEAPISLFVQNVNINVV
jgi:hypothetical protein